MTKNIVFTILLAFSFYSFAQVTKPSEDSVLLKVKVKDYNNKLRVNDAIVFYAKNAAKSFEYITNTKGEFEALLPEGDTYEVKILGLGNYSEYKSFEIPKEPGAFEMALDIKYEPAISVELKNINFLSGKAELSKTSFKELDDLAHLLKIKKTMCIEVIGHTDNVGNAAKNAQLSKLRAEEIKKYLLAKSKISNIRITTKGMGSSSPIADNTTEEGRAANRRTEIKITKE
ncbi:MAG: OmpA family protein [Cytophagales bacterium]